MRTDTEPRPLGGQKLPKERQLGGMSPFATAISVFPSPLKSPTAAPYGLGPTGKSEWDPKRPVPFPSKTLTALAKESVAIRSSAPSPFKSVSKAQDGVLPVLYSRRVLNVPSPFPSSVLMVEDHSSEVTMSVFPSWLK